MCHFIIRDLTTSLYYLPVAIVSHSVTHIMLLVHVVPPYVVVYSTTIIILSLCVNCQSWLN